MRPSIFCFVFSNLLTICRVVRRRLTCPKKRTNQIIPDKQYGSGREQTPRTIFTFSWHKVLEHHGYLQLSDKKIWVVNLAHLLYYPNCQFTATKMSDDSNVHTYFQLIKLLCNLELNKNDRVMFTVPG